ncbi:MAG: BtpA/SgcQ family protein [bacterium]|nr:BtpA/SgcQ family protein [bacterium]
MFSFPQPLVIGMVHLPPLVGREGAVSFDAVCARGIADRDALLAGGISGIMVENMYDFPHTERLDDARRQEFRALLGVLTRDLSVPFGISLLWNDYPAAFAFASEFGASWIRVPVFVDSVATQYGTFQADPAAVIRARDAAGAAGVGIFADIQVKHAQMLAPRPIAESARAAAAAGADAIIITGTWTGEPAAMADVAEAHAAVSVPILIGSGMTAANIASYLPHIAGCIVGTSLKAGGAHDRTEHRLRTPWETPVDSERVRVFMCAVQ